MKHLIPLICVIIVACFGGLWAVAANQTINHRQEILLTDEEISKLIRHGPWPPTQAADRSNRVSGNREAINFGKSLFFDQRLSSNGQVSCATCHDPQKGWTDSKPIAGGLERLHRNTQSLYNVSQNRWYGWDGRNDSLWAHSIGPILDPKEMGNTPKGIADLVRGDQKLSHTYFDVFGHNPKDRKPTDLLVDLSKALAAFQETIISERTQFDSFRDALEQEDFVAASLYPVKAQRGAALFVGQGKCNLCHLGARFTSDEFEDGGVPYFIAPGQVDRGRFGGIKKLKASPYNLLGGYNDLEDKSNAWATRQVTQTHRTFGQFKVPSLRQLIHTAPYMHDGSLRTLNDVVRHYSNIDLDRVHSDGAIILSPLNLSPEEISDLEAFLKTLSTPQP